MHVITNNVKATQDRQKSNVDEDKAFKEFQVREHVYLHINPKNIFSRIKSCAKLAPRNCGPFEIFERIGPMAYKITLPLIVKFHDVFMLHCLKYMWKILIMLLIYLYCRFLMVLDLPT